MSCDGPRYGHMEEQRIVALISEYNKKEADEGVEDKNDVPQTSKFPFSYTEAKQKMDDCSVYCRCQPKATPESVYNSLYFMNFLLSNKKALSNKPPFFPFSKRVPILVKLFTA